MISTFVNPVVNPDARLGVRSFDETAPVRLWQTHSSEDAEVVIRAAYRQVLGNAHVMESERLVVPESQLRRCEISVREFIRQLAKSALYRTRFFEGCYRYRAIELNFKHLLGRAPESYEEMSEHSNLLDNGGFEAEIDSYIDSDEYLDAFGEDTVPYYRGYKTQTGKNIVGFTHMLQLLRGASSSDKDLFTNERSRLNGTIVRNQPSSVIPVAGAPSSYWTPDSYATSSYGYSVPTTTYTAAEPALQQKVQEQEQLIATLQKQLAELRPFAAIGASYVKSDWQPSSAPDSANPYGSLEQQSNTQTVQIEALQEQIADARRYAAVGEARLNKWRSRVFNG